MTPVADPSSPTAPPVHDTYYFFGENYRTFCNYLHINDGAKVALAFDILKNVLETLFLSGYIGYLDAFMVLHLSWSLIGYLGALIGFFHKRYWYFMPYMILKIIDCATCISCLIGIVLLVLSGNVGGNLLVEIIKWMFPRVEREDALGFSLVLFLVLSVALIFNLMIFDVAFRNQLYYKRRHRYNHQFQRHIVTRQVII